MCGSAPCEKPDCTWSEFYRFECEAKWVAKQDKAARQRHYRKVASRRGREATYQLVERVRELGRLFQENQSAG